MESENQNQPEQPQGPKKFVPQAPPPNASYSMPTTSGLAIASLILAFFVPILGLIFGIIALRKINKNRDTLTGSGLAIAGIVTSCVIAVFSTLILAAILFPVFAKDRERTRSTHCTNNLKQQAIAMQMYCEDNDGSFPDLHHWNDSIRPYIKDPKVAFICPTAKDKTFPSYAAYDQLQSWAINEIKASSETPMLFDSKPGINKVGGPGATDYRHTDGVNFAFVDGHVSWRQKDGLEEDGWKEKRRNHE